MRTSPLASIWRSLHAATLLCGCRCQPIRPRFPPSNVPPRSAGAVGPPPADPDPVSSDDVTDCPVQATVRAALRSDDCPAPSCSTGWARCGSTWTMNATTARVPTRIRARVRTPAAVSGDATWCAHGTESASWSSVLTTVSGCCPISSSSTATGLSSPGSGRSPAGRPPYRRYAASVCWAQAPAALSRARGGATPGTTAHSRSNATCCRWSTAVTGLPSRRPLAFLCAFLLLCAERTARPGLNARRTVLRGRDCVVPRPRRERTIGYFFNLVAPVSDKDRLQMHADLEAVVWFARERLAALPEGKKDDAPAEFGALLQTRTGTVVRDSRAASRHAGRPGCRSKGGGRNTGMMGRRSHRRIARMTACRHGAHRIGTYSVWPGAHRTTVERRLSEVGAGAEDGVPSDGEVDQSCAPPGSNRNFVTPVNLVRRETRGRTTITTRSVPPGSSSAGRGSCRPTRSPFRAAHAKAPPGRAHGCAVRPHMPRARRGRSRGASSAGPAGAGGGGPDCLRPRRQAAVQKGTLQQGRPRLPSLRRQPGRRGPAARRGAAVRGHQGRPAPAACANRSHGRMGQTPRCPPTRTAVGSGDAAPVRRSWRHAVSGSGTHTPHPVFLRANWGCHQTGPLRREPGPHRT